MNGNSSAAAYSTRSKLIGPSDHITKARAIILAVALTAILPLSPLFAQNDDLPELLTRFHTTYLPNVDLSREITFPPDADVQLAMTGLVVAVAQDALFIVTAGQTEVTNQISSVRNAVGGAAGVGLKVAEGYVSGAGAVARSTGVEVAIDAAEHLAFFGQHIPGIRTGVAVYGFFEARAGQEERIEAQVRQQASIMESVGTVGPIAGSLAEMTSRHPDAAQRDEYQAVHRAMYDYAVRLELYRRTMKNADGVPAWRDLDYALDQAIVTGAQGPYTASPAVMDPLDAYLMGDTDSDAFVAALRETIRTKLSARRPTSVSERDIDAIMQERGVAAMLRQIDTHRDRINRYGGGVDGASPLSYADIVRSVGRTPRAAAPQIAAASGDALSIGFVLDSSGSMSSNDPQELSKDAVGVMLDLLGGQEALYLVEFDSRARWLNQTNWQGWSRQDLRRVVEAISFGGGTDIGAGLAAMQNALQTTGRVGAGGVLLLSDGIGDYESQAEWFRDNRIPVYTISFVGEANASLLEEIAIQTGGEYYKARNDQDLMQAFSAFLNRITDKATLVYRTEEIQQGQRITVPITVDQGTTVVNALIGWPGSTVRLTLTDPTGRTYRNDGSDNWRVGDRYVAATIHDPVPGQWEAVLFGEDIPEGGEPVSLEVSSDAPAHIVFEAATGVDGSIRMSLSAESGSGARVRFVETEVIRPDGTVRSLGSTLRGSQATYWPDAGAGTYTLRTTMEIGLGGGEVVQRYLTRSTVVGNLPPPNIGVVTEVLGTYVNGNIGTERGNRSGIALTVQREVGGSYQTVATGYVTRAGAGQCTIEIQSYGALGRVQVGDRIELDPRQWQND